MWQFQTFTSRNLNRNRIRVSPVMFHGSLNATHHLQFLTLQCNKFKDALNNGRRSSMNKPIGVSNWERVRNSSFSQSSFFIFVKKSFILSSNPFRFGSEDIKFQPTPLEKSL